MGLLDNIKKASGLFVEVDETTPTTQATQPINPQTAPVYQQPVNYVQTNNVLPNAFSMQTGPNRTDEDKQKYQTYFSALFTSAKAKSANYGEFLTNIETVNETDATLPEVNKFKMAFSFLKKRGVLKEQLIQSCNDAIAIVENDRTSKFDVDINSKTASIENNNKTIAAKKQQIQKLSEEIVALEHENDETKNRISVKTYLYNNFATQLINKIKTDLSGISNHL